MRLRWGFVSEFAAVLERLPDGTVKQRHPISGTQVWTVPGRGNRPLVPPPVAHHRLDPAADGKHCAFCHLRYLETTPEKARLVRLEGTPPGAREWRTLTGLTAEQLTDTIAEFRLVPNLFEIVSLDYWRANHGYTVPSELAARRAAYVGTLGGLSHVERLMAIKADSGGSVDSLFGGFHDVVIARRHFVEDALCDDELAGAGTLTLEEHRHYLAFTVAAMRAMYVTNPRVRNVAVFQNWLRPAGASFDHLHKQLVGLDTLGTSREREERLLAENPDAIVNSGRPLALAHDLLIAENEHAFAFAGVGHRFPSVEVWSKDADALPWELSRAALDGWSDLLHACHRATGVHVPTNEEWHYRPPLSPGTAPLRAVLKWRVNTSAGFEGGTEIHVNTIDPWAVRDRVADRLSSDAGPARP